MQMVGFEYFHKLFDSASNLTVFDVGAHHGDSVNEFLTLFPNAQIFAFEPESANFGILAQKFKISSKISLMNMAVGNKNIKTDFYRNNYSATNSLLPINSVEINRWADSNDFYQEAVLQVDQITIDKFCIDRKIDIINILKLDIQGGELMALEGASEMLSNQSIECLFCEVEFRQLYENQPLIWDISAYLMAKRYHLLNIVNPKVSDMGVLTWADAIFVNDRLWQALASRHSAGKLIT